MNPWYSITCSMDGLKVAAWNVNGMQFSKNGGTSGMKTSNVNIISGGGQLRLDRIPVTISLNGDRILGLSINGFIFTSKKCEVVDNKLFDESNFTLNLSESLKNVCGCLSKI